LNAGITREKGIGNHHPNRCERSEADDNHPVPSNQVMPTLVAILSQSVPLLLSGCVVSREVIRASREGFVAKVAPAGSKRNASEEVKCGGGDRGVAMPVRLEFGKGAIQSRHPKVDHFVQALRGFATAGRNRRKSVEEGLEAGLPKVP